MKKGFVVGLATGLTIAGASLVLANSQIQAILNDQIKITLNGQVQEFRDETSNEIQYPITYHDRTYLPLRTVANLVGVGVDYDANTNTAILSSSNTSINEIDISQGSERTEEYKENLKKQMADIKNALVGAGELKLQSAHTSENRDEYMEYWGSSYRYGGGLRFNSDDTFIFTIGSWADTFDRGGRYIIDMNNNQIIYIFYDGTVEYGTYGYSMGKIDKVTYVDASYHSDKNDKLIVELVAEKQENISNDEQ